MEGCKSAEAEMVQLHWSELHSRTIDNCINLDYNPFFCNNNSSVNLNGVCPYYDVIIKDVSLGLDWRFSSPPFPTSAYLNRETLL